MFALRKLVGLFILQINILLGLLLYRFYSAESALADAVGAPSDHVFIYILSAALLLIFTCAIIFAAFFAPEE